MSTTNSPTEAFPDIFPPARIKVLGAGRFGKIAAERLKRRFPDAALSIVDRTQSRVIEITRELGIQGDVEDAITHICDRDLPEDLWLIPAVPSHVGFQWLINGLNRSGKAEKIPVPEELDSRVPNPIRVPAGTLYASFATFICPDFCREPEENCTHTGKARPGNLFEVFGSIRAPGFEVEVLRSWQLAPGVGGYPGRSLNAMFSRIREKPGRYLVATSCRCHGVLDAFEWTEG